MRRRLHGVVGLLILVPLGVGLLPGRRASAEVRTWTHKSGSPTVEADFIDANNGQVWLRVPSGGTFNVPLDSLSQADQDYVRDLLAREHAQRAALAPRPGPETIHYGRGRKLCDLACRQLDESSGLAVSRRAPGLFWSHNDSDNDARLYLFDRQGRDLGWCFVKDTKAFDWEDIASFTAEGKPYLLIADTGNNNLAAAVHMLHVLEEPPVDPQRGVLVREVPLVRTIYFSFEDDYRNCEAVGIDPTDKTILLVSKERGRECHAYVLPWPKEKEDVKKAHVARVAATLRLRQATGLDVSPDGRRAIVVTYNNAFEFVRGEKDDWFTALARPPREIPLPDRLQGESICYGSDGKTLYLTSERLPTPLWEVPVERIGPAK
ncbi:MAG: SHD1 domain-containing protein [Thermoguttaceae bacterium]|nr:SHD1 domain-containing protein [Thermoguttaceae bacterium]